MSSSKQEKIFLQKIFSCCFPQQQNEEEEKKSEIDMIKTSINNYNSSWIFPAKYIRPEEFNKISFNEEGIKKFIDDLCALNYEKKFENEEIKISQIESSPLNQNIFLLRCEAVKSKFLFQNKVPTLKEIANAIYNPEKRLQWDNNTKSIEILEKFNDKAVVVKSITNRLLAFISERELIEKRFDYFINDNEYYNFASSIPDDLYPPEEEPIRCTSYISIFIIKEDESNFIFDSFNQIDLKMNIPKNLITMSFPIKMKDFFNKLIGYINNKNE